MDATLSHIKALAVKVHSTLIFRSGIQGKRKMNQMFYKASALTLGVGTQKNGYRSKLLRSTKTLGVGTWQETTMNSDVSFRFCVQPRHWELEHSASDLYGWNDFIPLLRSTKTLGVGTHAQVTDMLYV